MVGSCGNCLTRSIVCLFTQTYQTKPLRCPVCDCCDVRAERQPTKAELAKMEPLEVPECMRRVSSPEVSSVGPQIMDDSEPTWDRDEEHPA